MYNYNAKSLKNIRTCHPDLQVLAFRVAKYRNCSALSGRRGEEEQNYLYQIGASTKKFPFSDHNTEPFSIALDLVPYKDTVPHIDWKDEASFIEFSGFVKAIALNCGTPVGSGLDWDNDLDFDDQTFMDGAHFWLLNPREITQDMLDYCSHLYNDIAEA
jgi:hypothetical protein